jgi:NADPH:quinone reductase-like Zn-dependent oxidoreductase
MEQVIQGALCIQPIIIGSTQ